MKPLESLVGEEHRGEVKSSVQTASLSSAAFFPLLRIIELAYPHHSKYTISI
jgi:hypothetical protein